LEKTSQTVLPISKTQIQHASMEMHLLVEQHQLANLTKQHNLLVEQHAVLTKQHDHLVKKAAELAERSAELAEKHCQLPVG